MSDRRISLGETWVLDQIKHGILLEFRGRIKEAMTKQFEEELTKHIEEAARQVMVHLSQHVQLDTYVDKMLITVIDKREGHEGPRR